MHEHILTFWSVKPLASSASAAGLWGLLMLNLVEGDLGLFVESLAQGRLVHVVRVHNHLLNGGQAILGAKRAIPTGYFLHILCPCPPVHLVIIIVGSLSANLSPIILI